MSIAHQDQRPSRDSGYDRNQAPFDDSEKVRALLHSWLLLADRLRPTGTANATNHLFWDTWREL